MSRYGARWILAVAAAALLAGWTSGPTAAQQAGVLRVPLGGESPTLDPYFAVDSVLGARLARETVAGGRAGTRIGGSLDPVIDCTTW